jgi:hypothetical protein
MRCETDGIDVKDMEGKTVCTVFPGEMAVEINNGGYITKVRFTQDGRCCVMVVENNVTKLSDHIMNGLDLMKTQRRGGEPV